MNNVTIYLDDMIKNIFKNYPSEPNTIKLTFDCKDENELFKILIQILTEGLKILYGDNDIVNLEYLTKEEFDKVKKYFKSFGFILNCKIDKILNTDNINDNIELPKLNNNVNLNNDINFNNKKKNNTELSLYYFKLKTKNMIYEISFDYL